jgi:hypothetical protein
MRVSNGAGKGPFGLDNFSGIVDRMHKEPGSKFLDF